MEAPSRVSRSSRPPEGGQALGLHRSVQLGCSEPLLSGEKGRNSSEIHVPRQGQGQAFQTHLPKESRSAVTLFCTSSYIHVLFLNSVPFPYCTNYICALLEKYLRYRLQKEEILKSTLISSSKDKY